MFWKRRTSTARIKQKEVLHYIRQVEKERDAALGSDQQKGKLLYGPPSSPEKLLARMNAREITESFYPANVQAEKKDI